MQGYHGSSFEVGSDNRTDENVTRTFARHCADMFAPSFLPSYSTFPPKLVLSLFLSMETSTIDLKLKHNVQNRLTSSVT